MLSKEYGAWAMLLVPLAVGMASGGTPGLEAFLFALACLALFLARYPLTLMVKAWLGRARGWPPRTLVWLAIYSLLSLGFSLPLFYPYRLGWLLPLGALALALFLASLYLLKERLERTEAGELLGVAGLTLAAPGAYYAALGGLEADAFYLWLLSFLYFGSSVFYVKMRVRHRALKDRSSWPARWRLGRDTALYHISLAPVILGLAFLGQVPILAPVAFFPLLAKALGAVASPAPRMSIRQVGVMEVGHAFLFGALLALAYRSPGLVS